MKLRAFATRTFKEIIRDPLTLFFGLGFPGVLILLLTAIQANIPVSLFELNRLIPGMTIFGLSFMTLFSASLIAKDRESSFLLRLYASPMRAVDFILGYTLPLLPIALVQSLFCFLIGYLLGMTPCITFLYALLLILPIALFFIGLGLLFGIMLTQKQVGGICGALLTNLVAYLSGIWFDLELVGGVFQKLAHLLPFYHAVQIEQLAVAGEFSQILPHLPWVLGYAVFVVFVSVWFFIKQSRKG